MRYKLRTLLFLLAVLPPLLWFGWTRYEAWKAEQERLKALERARLLIGDDDLLLQLSIIERNPGLTPQPKAPLPSDGAQAVP